LGKTLPDQDGHRPRPQKRPHGRFERARIRSREDADEIMIRNSKDFFCCRNGLCKLLLPEGGTMGSTHGRVPERIQAPLGSFAAGAGTEVWIVHRVVPFL